MCLRGSPPPVFIDGGGSQTPFLDDLVGWTLADRLRALVGYRPLHGLADNPYGLICGGPDSYLSTSFSSVWALGVFLFSLAAGFIFSSRRKSALAILASAAAVSLLDTGIRVAARLDRGEPEYRDSMLGALPAQLAANLLFQILLPFAFALLLVHIARAMRWSLAKMFRRPQREQSGR
jgi:hypothetical protein